MSETRFCHLENLGRIRISGPSAELFVRTMTTVDMERLSTVGATAPSLILTSEAEVIDVVMLVRSGDNEYMLTSSRHTREEVFLWLNAHAELSDASGLVFQGLELTDETDSLVTIAVYGPHAALILNDLAAQDLALALGEASSTLCALDGIPAFVFRYPLLPDGYFELSVVPSYAPLLAHLLMSFPEIDPASYEEFRAARQACHTWFAGAETSEYQYPNSPELQALIRTSYDFVGGRELTAI